MTDFELLLLDTHVWLWMLEGNPRIGAAARKAISAASVSNSLRISAISIFEVALLIRKNRIVLSGTDSAAWMESALSIQGLSVIPVDARIALRSQQLESDFQPDPADRFIVATSLLEKCRLVTADKAILAFAKKTKLKVLALK
jgi:PIN domain nuclease of toxin-antitoxin system